MRTFLALLFGIVIGALVVWYFRGNLDNQKMEDARKQIETQARSTADTVQTKLRSWHLGSQDISNELSRTGHVIRERAQQAGRALSDATADARVTAAIKAKLLRDPDLSVWNISVATSDGIVTMSGSVSSPDQVGKAILLALETDGVRQVISTLQVKPAQRS